MVRSESLVLKSARKRYVLYSRPPAREDYGLGSSQRLALGAFLAVGGIKTYTNSPKQRRIFVGATPLWLPKVRAGTGACPYKTRPRPGRENRSQFTTSSNRIVLCNYASDATPGKAPACTGPRSAPAEVSEEHEGGSNQNGH